MSHRKNDARQLLSGLKPTVLPQPAAPPAAELERAAAALMGTAAPAAVPPDVQPAVPPAVQQHSPLIPKHRDVLFSTSFRIPVSLKRELDDVADFNRIPRSEILVEALRRLLLSLPHPPQGWRK